MDLLSADEARDAVARSGATVLPGVKVLKEAAKHKVFSGKKPDGAIWKICKETEDGFSVEC